MFNTDFPTVFGYLASTVTAISLLMNRPLRLRWLNLIGSLLFAIYGLLIEAYPVALFNAIIVFIDAYYLLQIYRSTSSFKALIVQNHNQTLQFFIDENEKEINAFFPNFRKDFNSNNLFVLIIRDMEIAGVVSGKIQNDELEITLDYTSPRNRDYKPGKFFFANSEILRLQNLKRIWTKAENKTHISYLLKMGFTKSNGIYTLKTA